MRRTMIPALIRCRNFAGLLAANTILGAAMPMLIVLGGLAGLALAPTPALVTIAPSIQLLAGLLTAGPFSWLMGRYGRRSGFVIGGCFAICGGVLGSLALIQSSFIILCLGHMCLGAALACYQYFRFAAAEAVSEQWQPVAISLMLTSGLVAAFVGPQLFILTKDLLASAPLAGAYAAICVLTLVGLCQLSIVKFNAPPVQHRTSNLNLTASLRALGRWPVLSAVIVGATAQALMVLLMAPTPLAMIGHGFSEAVAGDVIRWHVVAMFAPSFFTGFLIQKFGARWVVATGFLLLTVSALLAATGLTPLHFYGSLIVLGVGWNFGFIGGTSMLASAVLPAERSLAQGINDTIIALASTVCAFASGAIVTSFGWPTLALTAIPVLLLAAFFLLPPQWIKRT